MKITTNSKLLERAAAAAAALTAAAAVALAGVPAAGADCCPQPSTPAPADFQIRFPQPLVLATSMAGQLRSQEPATYHGTATLDVGADAVVTRSLKAGRSGTSWRALTVRFTAAQVRRAIAAARREHRRVVLSVTVVGTLAGHHVPSRHLRRFILTLPKA